MCLPSIFVPLCLAGICTFGFLWLLYSGRQKTKCKEQEKEQMEKEQKKADMSTGCRVQNIVNKIAKEATCLDMERKVFRVTMSASSNGTVPDWYTGPHSACLALGAAGSFVLIAVAFNYSSLHLQQHVTVSVCRKVPERGLQRELE
ncbi:hypothetical protein ACLKA7_017178 [Drosophila subpalustris]